MQWNVLYLRPRTEKKMATICGAMGLEYYLPLRMERKIYQRRAVTTHIPLFPSYFFVQYSNEHLDTMREFQLLLKEIKPQKESALIHDLDQIRKALEIDPTLGAARSLKNGLRVRIIDGPFSGIEGKIAKIRGITKVSLNVDLINQAVKVEVSGDQLEIIE